MQIADELTRIARGEVLSDDWNKQIYSVDASHYQVSPCAIIHPEDEQDLKLICEYSYANNLQLTARGAGTGLLGQSLSSGIVVDFTKHMNKIIEIGDDFVTVEPGMIKGILDRELAKRKKVPSAGPCKRQLLYYRGHDSR
jgi:glycolate oxidase